jgi:hypothetical protein
LSMGDKRRGRVHPKKMRSVGSREEGGSSADGAFRPLWKKVIAAEITVTELWERETTGVKEECGNN